MSPALDSATTTATAAGILDPPRAPAEPVAPHGGALVDRFVGASETGDLGRRAAGLPTIVLDARERADLELIATGAASPLTGFLGARDYAAVVEGLRLADGTVWPLPLTLAVSDDTASRLRPGEEAALRDGRGRLWGLVQVDEMHERDPLHEARHVYGTTDPAHPGVAYLLDRPRRLVGGPVRVLPLPDDLPFAAHRLTPRDVRSEIRRRGWRSVAGFQTRNPIHRAHEHLTKLALETADGLVIHPLVGETKGDDVPAAVRFRAYQVLLARYYPKERTLLAAFPAAMRYAGPREALFHALVRKNYGIDRLIVGRDHAGVGTYYGPYDAQRIFDRFAAEELGVSPLRLEPTFFCRACDALGSTRTCPHGAGERLELSGTRVRQILSEGGELPREFTRPEVAAILRDHYAAARTRPAPAPPAAVATAQPDPAGAARPSSRHSKPAADPAFPVARRACAGDGRRPGFIVWFTGLSGAGKSTLAAALRDRLAADRPFEVLDGDEVRTFLSKGLGFSKADRDTNIRRIGYVARLLARAGAGVATAAISPYAETRDEVRRLAERDGVAFLEVFVDAPLDVLAARDVKGLYRKALAGEIPHFTGVSDPYEPPARPDLRVRSDAETVEESFARLLDLLDSRGLLGAPGALPRAPARGPAP